MAHNILNNRQFDLNDIVGLLQRYVTGKSKGVLKSYVIACAMWILVIQYQYSVS